MLFPKSIAQMTVIFKFVDLKSVVLMTVIFKFVDLKYSEKGIMQYSVTWNYELQISHYVINPIVLLVLHYYLQSGHTAY